MKVFLTGGTGYLGEHVAQALVARGHAVCALARDPRSAEGVQRLGVDVRIGDLLDPASWRDALRGVDGVLHTAAMVQSWARPRERFQAVNVESALALLAAAREAGVSRLVVTGSLFTLGPSPDGRPRDEAALDEPASPLSRVNDYVRTKRVLVERLRADTSSPRPILGFPTVLFGPGRRTAGNHTAHIIEAIARRRLPGLVGNGQQIWNLVPVERAAQGLVLALERGREGEAYILGGENWTQEQFVTRVAELLGVPSPRRRLGTALPLAVGAAGEAWAALTGKAPALTRGEVRLYDAHWAFTSAKAERELEYAADGIDAAVVATVAWVRRALEEGA